ncbi:MAG: hypothetical protein IH845_02385 [Nanoarchaeota archaeon]|nr:hypothetical protein [Nanoarchaeota archaeon]
MEMCDMSHKKMIAWEVAVVAFTILVLRLWTTFHDWLFSISIWWFVAIVLIGLLKSGCCNMIGSSNAKGKMSSKKKK